MDLIRRGQHQPGTCLSGDCHNVGYWKQRIHWQWHCPLLDRGGEGLGEAGTVRQHDQYSLGGTYVELNQRSDDSRRLIGRFGIAHLISHRGECFRVTGTGCPGAQFWPDGQGRQGAPAGCGSNFSPDSIQDSGC
jgi:hypothetical protein